MKQLAIFTCCCLPLLACNKNITRSGIRSFTGPNPATEGSLLLKQVTLFPDGDTLVVSYDYDAAKQLTAMHKTGFLPYDTYYERDAMERITRRIVIQDTATDTLDVSYASPTLGIVGYTLERTADGFRDSAAYTYNPNHYAVSIAIYSLTVLPAQLGSVDSISYDANGNVTAFRTFMPGTGGQFSLNLGYEFQSDNDVNPLYSPDDCRIADEGAVIISPNNQLKQTNQYGDPPLLPGNYVTWTYQYRSDRKPSTSTPGGTAISPGAGGITTYIYQ
jgi:hypothetical protein